jgi:hypothetical protein
VSGITENIVKIADPRTDNVATWFLAFANRINGLIDALSGKASSTDLTNHINDGVKHITADERNAWNAISIGAQCISVYVNPYIYNVNWLSNSRYVYSFTIDKIPANVSSPEVMIIADLNFSAREACHNAGSFPVISAAVNAPLSGQSQREFKLFVFNLGNSIALPEVMFKVRFIWR